MSAACNWRYVRLRGEADMPALTAVTGLRSRGSGRSRQLRSTRDPGNWYPATACPPSNFQTPRLLLVRVTQNPQVHSVDDGCYRSAIWTDSNPHDPDLWKQSCT